MKKLDKALEIAYFSHLKVNRKFYNIPYLSHPLEVCKMLCLWQISCEKILATAILHDTVEDAEDANSAMWIVEQIKTMNDTDILVWVEDLTYRPNLENKDDYLARFQTHPIESLLVKLADRCCNLKDFYFENPMGYFRKYFKKSTALFTIYKNRRKEIVDGYGELVAMHIDGEISNLTDMYMKSV